MFDLNGTDYRIYIYLKAYKKYHIFAKEEYEAAFSKIFNLFRIYIRELNLTQKRIKAWPN